MFLTQFLYGLVGNQMIALGVLILMIFIVNEIVRMVVTRLRAKAVHDATRKGIRIEDMQKIIKFTNYKCNIANGVATFITIFAVIDSFLFIGFQMS